MQYYVYVFQSVRKHQLSVQFVGSWQLHLIFNDACLSHRDRLNSLMLEEMVVEMATNIFS